MKTPKKATTRRAAASGAVNHAALHRDELMTAIDGASRAELRSIDADLAREGWDHSGVARSRIAARLSSKE